MEATLHEVAADLGRLALLYRSQGKAQHAVPLHMHACTLTSYIAHRTSHISHRAPHIVHRAPCTVHRAPCTVHRASRTVQVPLYMTALAIYEKTLGPEHPEVAKDLVNLGNAFCDQDQHSEAVPLYLRSHPTPDTYHLTPTTYHLPPNT